MSRYGVGDVTPSVLASEVLKLKVAFPSRLDPFFNLLSERIIANGFTDARLKDAVGRALDTFSYKEINISDIINYDRKTRLYTYGEMCDMVFNGMARGEDFELREINNRKFWVKITDL